MARTVLQRLFSFTGHQQGQGDDSFPGTQLDQELDRTNGAVETLVQLVASLVRADGKLNNGVVTRNALAADVRLGLGASRPWTTPRAYTANDTVTQGYGLYQCLITHISGVFAADLAAGKWVLIADLSQAVVIAAGAIGTGALADGAATEPKLGTGAASNRVLGAGAVTRDKANINLGNLPVGAESDYAGLFLPAGWLFCNGTAVSRTTYADLFGALTAVVPGSTAVGSDSLATGSSNLTGFGLVGSAIEGPGIAANTIVLEVSASALKLSQPALTTNGSATYRLMPWGRGDGSTTFNVPDRRGRVVAGRDTMFSATANRLLSAFPGDRLGAAGGADGEILTNAHLPVNLPNPQANVGFPPHVYRKSRENNLNFFNGTNSGGNVTANAGADDALTTAPQPAAIAITLQNPGGGQAHNTVQPTGIANRIIFAGA